MGIPDRIAAEIMGRPWDEESMLDCPSCQKRAKVCRWPDTVMPNATWIECECGMMTDTQHDEDPDIAKRLAIRVWNGNRKRK